MAGAAWLVTQKGLTGYQKFPFHGIPTIIWAYFEVKLGWCSNLVICLIKDPVCDRQQPKAEMTRAGGMPGSKLFLSMDIFHIPTMSFKAGICQNKQFKGPLTLF